MKITYEHKQCKQLSNQNLNNNSDRTNLENKIHWPASLDAINGIMTDVNYPGSRVTDLIVELKHTINSREFICPRY